MNNNHGSAEPYFLKPGGHIGSDVARGLKIVGDPGIFYVTPARYP